MNRLVLPFAAALALLLAACVEPPLVDMKVIVGATLIDGANVPLPHSVIVIREGRISAVGPQQSTPIPAGSEKINGSGKYVAPANRGMRIEPGAPADLLLLSANPLERPENFDRIERRMVAGKWVDK
jgi:imidazolonepropionase-like amidohydrolase